MSKLIMIKRTITNLRVINQIFIYNLNINHIKTLFIINNLILINNLQVKPIQKLSVLRLINK